jgi:UDP-N-acetylmuramoyl-tripeptide--D-alanyl-D-alanine ligase
VTRFAKRWWTLTPFNPLLAAVAIAGFALTPVFPAAGLATAAAVAVGPLGLGLRGRTSKLAWTRRLRTLAGCWLVVQALAVGLGAVGGLDGAAIAAVGGALVVPAAMDLALLLTAPVERRLADRHVAAAATRLQAVRPLVVAVTGSYGKTTTKGYIAHLLDGRFEVLPSPASYNNQAGLSRTVNERLTESTEVLVAEMGAYGPGEIAEMCSWLRPRVSVITAIGPAHLERFGSLERTLAAKSEITDDAEVAVLNTDDPLLAGLAVELAAAGKRVIRCSAVDPDADVLVSLAGGRAALSINGAPPAEAPVPTSGRPAAAPNVACAIGVAVALGCSWDEIAGRLATLPLPPNRLELRRSPSGVTVLDDTYNSNPSGCRAALAALSGLGGDGVRRVVVTPGMVELGTIQHAENATFAREAVAVATDLVVVGRTNRRALLEGARAGSPAAGAAPRVRLERVREEAVAFVRSQLADGDVVLYENDLPDHYP